MEEFKTLQRFVILMYSKASDHLRVNEARLDFFFQKDSKSREYSTDRKCIA